MSARRSGLAKRSKNALQGSGGSLVHERSNEPEEREKLRKEPEKENASAT